MRCFFVLQFSDKHWQHISEPAKDLLQEMLAVDPQKRVTIEDALTHPWVAVRTFSTLGALFMIPTCRLHKLSVYNLLYAMQFWDFVRHSTATSTTFEKNVLKPRILETPLQRYCI